MWKLLGAESLPEESRKKLGIVALLYFIQGAPAAILWEVLPVYFHINGVSLRAFFARRLRDLCAQEMLPKCRLAAQAPCSTRAAG
jgi:hypothetical protein